MAHVVPDTPECVVPVFVRVGIRASNDRVGHLSAIPRVVIGRSLGASRAAILTALMVLDGQPPLRRVVWGEPKPGFQRLASIAASVPGVSYRNADGRHHDLITDCPFSFPPEEYVRAGHAVDVCQRPTVDHRLRLGIFAWHHMQLYAQAATA